MQHTYIVPFEELSLNWKSKRLKSVFITSRLWETNLFQELICIHIQIYWRVNHGGTMKKQTDSIFNNVTQPKVKILW